MVGDRPERRRARGRAAERCAPRARRGVRAGGSARRVEGVRRRACRTCPTWPVALRLPPEIALYEPRAALFGGPDGLDPVRRLLPMVADVRCWRWRSGWPRRSRAARRAAPAFQLGRDPARSRRDTSASSSAAGERQPRRLSAASRSGASSLFGADTVYGLACDPEDRFAVERLYLLKRRQPRQALGGHVLLLWSAALAALPELGERTREAMARLLPGAVSVLVPNPAGRFALACGDDVSTLGVRVPVVPRVRRRAPARASVERQPRRRPADPRTLDDVPPLLRAAVDLVIDGGELAGDAVDRGRSAPLRGRRRMAACVREGAVNERELTEALHWQYHFDASTLRGRDPGGPTGLRRAPGCAYRRERLRRSAHPGAGDRHGGDGAAPAGAPPQTRRWWGSTRASRCWRWRAMRCLLRACRCWRDGSRARFRSGPFDLVASALCVHHLDGVAKAELFERVRARSRPAGCSCWATWSCRSTRRRPPLRSTPGYDRPSPLADQLGWLARPDSSPRCVWEQGDLAVVAARGETWHARSSPPLRRNLTPEWPLDDNSGDRFHC